MPGRTLILAAVAMLLQVPSATADVNLTMKDGRVTLKATDATLREILAEWARVGRTTILNADRVVGGPMTIELADVPEGVALGILLRPLSGFIAAPRAAALQNTSHFDRILVLPTSAPPRASVAAPPPAFGVPPGVSSPLLPQPADPVDERDAPPQNPRGPAFSGFPQPQVPSEQPPAGAGQQPAQPVYQPRPGAVTGAAVPGMVVPAPQPADQSTPQPRTF